MKEGRRGVQERYPDMVHLTKTEETDFEEFKEEHIQRINDDWTTHLSTMRSDPVCDHLSVYEELCRSYL